MTLPAGSTNTGNKNRDGRTIYKGPRGGLFVMRNGKVVRTFKRATASAAAPAAPSALNSAKAHMNTLKTAKNRKLYVRSRAANMELSNWTALNRYRKSLNFWAPRRAKLAKMKQLSNGRYVNKKGNVYNKFAQVVPNEGGVSARAYAKNERLMHLFRNDPKFLNKKVIPYIPYLYTNEAAALKKAKVKPTGLAQGGKNMGRSLGINKMLYYNKDGHLYHVTLNGRKHRINGKNVNYRYKLNNNQDLRELKRVVARAVPNYPRHTIPASPARSRTAAELLNNMITQIYEGGRGSNVNANRYTAAERAILAQRLAESIDYFKGHRNAKKQEAAEARLQLKNVNAGSVGARLLKQRINAANERVGYYDDAVRAYTRGLRAVKPLSGTVTPRSRARSATPNRATPAPANVNMNAIYMPLNRPHLVVKTPGAGTIYLNPNTFVGFMKNSARVTIKPANVRNWLRMARRNFPNEALFRHPLAAKNVTASQIRFSR